MNRYLQRALLYLVASAAMAGGAGCGANHVTDCEGGVHMFVYFPAELLEQTDRMEIHISADGMEPKVLTFPVAQLDGDGSDDLVVNFEFTTATSIDVYAVMLDAQDTPLAFDYEQGFTVQPLTTGCQDLNLNIGGAGPDAGVPDAAPFDATPPPDACRDAGCPPPDAWIPPDAWTPPDAFGGQDAPTGWDAPANDTDGDGVINITDNCPVNWNPDQNDEDGDTRGDVCDNCPIDVNLAQANADGDGVGNACDPHPDSSQEGLWDYIQWMDGFGGAPGMVSGYWLVGGQWYKSSGQVQNMTLNGDTAMQTPPTAAPDPIGTGDELRLYTRYTVTSEDTENAASGAGALLFTTGGLSNGWRCAALVDTDSLVITDMQDKTTVDSQAVVTNLSATYNLTMTSYPNNLIGGNNVECTVAPDGLAAGVDDTPPVMGTQFGLAGVYASVRYNYLFVIKSTSAIQTAN